MNNGKIRSLLLMREMATNVAIRIKKALQISQLLISQARPPVFSIFYAFKPARPVPAPPVRKAQVSGTFCLQRRHFRVLPSANQSGPSLCCGVRQCYRPLPKKARSDSVMSDSHWQFSSGAVKLRFTKSSSPHSGGFRLRIKIDISQ